MTQARINLGQIARRAHVHKEYFILEKDGMPVMGIMDADELEDYLDLRDPKIQRAAAQAREDHFAGRTRPAKELQDELERVNARKAKRTKPKKA